VEEKEGKEGNKYSGSQPEHIIPETQDKKREREREIYR